MVNKSDSDIYPLTKHEATRAWLNEILQQICDDADELIKHIAPSEDELAQVALRLLELELGHLEEASPSTPRCRAITYLEAAKSLSRRVLPEIEGNDAESVVYYLCAAQQLITKAAGGCLGLQLATSKDEVNHLLSTLQPLAAHGQLFRENRKKGYLSPIAEMIKAHLAKHRRATAEEVWNSLKRASPKGYAFMESPRLGRYIESGVDTVMQWPRFRNLVSEHRPKPK